MAKTEGTYIQIAYKNVFGYISTNSWPSFLIQRPTNREKCAWVRSNTSLDGRPVATGFFRFFDFSTNVATGNRKIQNLCNHNRWSGLLQLGSVQFQSFFQSSELDLRTLVNTEIKKTVGSFFNLTQWNNPFTHETHVIKLLKSFYML